MNTQKWISHKPALWAVFFWVVVSAWLVGRPGLRAGAEPDNPSASPAGFLVSGPRTLPGMDDQPEVERAVVVDPRSPGWVTRYGTQAGLKFLPPRQPVFESYPQGPDVPLGAWKTFDLGTSASIVAVQGVPDGRVFAAAQYDGLRVYTPTSDGSYTWSEIHSSMGGLASDNVTCLAYLNGELWVCTANAGVSVLTLWNNVWRTYNIGNSPLPSNIVNHITPVPAYLPDSVLYISTENGAARYHDENWIAFLIGTHIKDIGVQFVGWNEYKWFATDYNVLFFDGVNWIPYGSGNTGDCNMWRAWRIVVDRAGMVWFNAEQPFIPLQAGRTPAVQEGDGVCTYNNGTWTYYNNVVPGLPSGGVTDLAVDEAGRVWISLSAGAAAYDQGTWLMITQTNGFPIFSDNVKSVSALGEAVWFGHQGDTAFSQFSPNWNYYTNSDMGGQPGDAPRAVLVESAETWVGLGAELAHYDGNTWNTNTIPGNPANVTALARGGDGLLYIGTEGNGLYTYHGGQFTHQTTADGLPGNIVRALLADHDGRLWAATDGGLALRGNGYWLSFTTSTSPLTENDLTALASDATSRLWIGTAGQGINLLNPKAQGEAAWSTQTTADSLPSNAINALATDPTGNIWAATAAGLAVWDPNTGTWTTEIGEPTLSVASDPQGRVWAGTTAALYMQDGDGWRAFHATNAMLGGDHVIALASDGDLLWALGNGLVAVRGVLTGPIGFYAPVIYSFNPTEGSPGALITLTGDHFDDRDPSYNEVRFGDDFSPQLRGYVVSASQTELTVYVPNLAKTGPIYVRAHGLNGVSPGTFTVVPKITSISPGCLGVGSLIYVFGSGFTSQNTNVYIRLGNGPWRYADVFDSTLLRYYVRPGDTSGPVQVRIGVNGPVVTSAQSIGISLPEVVDLNIQQGIQGEQMIWGKRTLITLSLRTTGSLCNAQVNGGYIEWKLKNGSPYKDSNVFLPSSTLQVRPIASGTELSEAASFVLGVQGYGWLLPAFSNFDGVRIHLTNGPVELLTYDIPASAFNFLNVGSRHHFLNIAVLPATGYTDQKYKDFLANTQQGLENVARVYPQQDITALYGSDSWMTWGYMTLFWDTMIDLKKGDDGPLRSKVENYRDLINDGGSPFLDQAMVVVDDNLRVGNTYGIAQVNCYDPFGDCNRYTSVSFSAKDKLAPTYLQESIHVTGWVDGGSPNHASYNDWHSRYDEGQWSNVMNCMFNQTFRQALLDQTGGTRRVMTLGNQAAPYEFSLAGCNYRNQPRSAMSYVPNNFNTQTFLEPLDYRHTLNWLLSNDKSDIGPLAPTTYTQTLRLNGEIDASDIVTVTMSYRKGMGGELNSPLAEGSYTLELRDASDALLVIQHFSLPVGHTHSDVEAPGRFSLHVPFPARARKAEIRHDGTVIWSATVSAQDPTVSLVTPNGGTYNAANLLNVNWTASDADGDPLQFSLEYSADNGATWVPIAAALTGNSFDWVPGFIPAGTQARLRLRASDGFNTSEAVSAPFTLTARPPFAFILSPESGAEFPEGAVVGLQGSSMTSDGVDSGAFTWTYDGDPVAIGSEKNITATLNEVGVHTLALQATSNGLSDTSSITVTVVPDYDRDGMPNAWELGYLLNPLDPTDAFVDTDSDGLTNLREYQLGTNPTAVDTDGDTAGDGAEVSAGTDPLRADQTPASGPILNVGAATLGFTHRQGSPAPAPWHIWITNGGAGSLSWTASGNMSWLNVTPGSGNAPTELVVSADPAGLPLGEYVEQITVTAEGASGSPQTLTVTLTIFPGSNTIYLPLVRRE